MKKPSGVHLLLYLFLIGLCFEVVVLSRQNLILTKQLRYINSSSQDGVSNTKEGEKVPGLELTNLSGERFAVTYHRPGTKTLIYFFSQSCPQCLKNIPQWRYLTNELIVNENVTVIGITGGLISDVKEYKNGYKLNYAIGVRMEDDLVIEDQYGIKQVPSTMIIDENSIIVKSIVGVLTEDDLFELMNMLL